MKRTICILLITLITAFSVVPVYAMETKNQENQNIVSPLFTHISFITTALLIDTSGKSTSYGASAAYNSSHKVNVTVELQKSSGSSWTAIKSWSVSGPGGSRVETENDYYVIKGTYRVCVTVKVYDASGKLLETQSEYSAAKTY